MCLAPYIVVECVAASCRQMSVYIWNAIYCAAMVWNHMRTSPDWMMFCCNTLTIPWSCQNQYPQILRQSSLKYNKI